MSSIDGFVWTQSDIQALYDSPVGRYEVLTINETLGAITIDRQLPFEVRIGGYARIARLVDTNVAHIGGHAQISVVEGSTRISMLSGHAGIDRLGGASVVRMVGDFVSIGTASGSARVEALTGQAMVVWGKDNARFERVSDQAQIGLMSDQSFVSVLTDNAEIGVVQDSAGIARMGAESRVNYVVSPYGGIGHAVGRSVIGYLVAGRVDMLTSGVSIYRVSRDEKVTEPVVYFSGARPGRVPGVDICAVVDHALSLSKPDAAAQQAAWEYKRTAGIIREGQLPNPKVDPAQYQLYVDNHDLAMGINTPGINHELSS